MHQSVHYRMPDTHCCRLDASVQVVDIDAIAVQADSRVPLPNPLARGRRGALTIAQRKMRFGDWLAVPVVNRLLCAVEFARMDGRLGSAALTGDRLLPGS